jgi:hypothetical protein
MEQSKAMEYESRKKKIKKYLYKMETLHGLDGTEREAGDSPPSSVEVTKKWSFTFTPPYAFLAYKKGKNFTYDTAKTEPVTGKLFSNV